MGPSPSPIWSVILYGLALYGFLLIFIYWPLAYWFLGRPFDKKFEIKYPTVEKGTWWIGPMARLASYTLGILLQPYRNKLIKNKLFKRIVKGRFEYQDRVYGKVVDFRKEATKIQIVISIMMWVGFLLLIITMFLVIFHNFVLYPEIGRAGFSN